MQSHKYENHFINRSNWLRAAVLGANDGILSTASLAVGVAAASNDRNNLILAVLAGLTAGALSMAAGEYVSVSSQTDLEDSDLEREKNELATMPEEELEELTSIYIDRGLTRDLAYQVAVQLTEHDALQAHARDELGIHDLTRANALQAAFASGASFTLGALLPLLVALFLSMKYMVLGQYIFSILALAIMGAISAKVAGSDMFKSALRISFWGTVAMGVTALTGYIFNISVF
ncbi:MAG: VIT family protein [Saprospiraceae bacterium]